MVLSLSRARLPAVEGGIEVTLAEQAAALGIVPPSVRTLRKYGITAEDWLTFLALQKWQCPICERRVASWNIDHEHVAGWKHLPAEERRRFVRGVLCVRCNWKLVNSRISAHTAMNVAVYLAAYEERRDSSSID